MSGGLGVGLNFNTKGTPRFVQICLVHSFRLYLLAYPPSPCIDIGSNSGADLLIDIDGEDRVQDGDYDCSGTPMPIVDLGFDEVSQPECP